MTQQCERRENGKGEWKCDHCEALWYGELAKTDWRPSECRTKALTPADGKDRP